MFIFTITGVLFTLSSVLSLLFLLLSLEYEPNVDNVGKIAPFIIIYIIALQTFTMLSVRYYQWPRWAIVFISLISIGLTVFSLINLSGYPNVSYYFISANLVAAVWSFVFFYTPLWDRFIQQRAKIFEQMNGYNPIKRRR
jgi:hypothetical protein